METSYPKVLCGAVVLGLCAGATGITPDTTVVRFGEIQRRNVFALTNPPPRVEAVQPPQLPRLILTGITTILGNKRALLKALPPGNTGKAADPSKELSLMLTEGQREGDFEVLQIDEKAGKVKVNNSGTVVTLTFEKDGPQPPASAPAAGTPALQAQLGGVRIPGFPPPPVPASNLQVPLPTGYTNRNIIALPTRRPQSNTPGALATNAPGNLTPSTAAAVPGALPYAQELPQELTPEEQAALAEVQRQISRSPEQNLPGRGSGTFTTPPQEGILPAFVTPQTQAPGVQGRVGQ